jgi:hypothetical protein
LGRRRLEAIAMAAPLCALHHRSRAELAEVEPFRSHDPVLYLRRNEPNDQRRRSPGDERQPGQAAEGDE